MFFEFMGRPANLQGVSKLYRLSNQIENILWIHGLFHRSIVSLIVRSIVRSIVNILGDHNIPISL